MGLTEERWRLESVKEEEQEVECCMMKEDTWLMQDTLEKRRTGKKGVSIREKMKNFNFF